ncbi:folylpolyglutamate synthase/dihydrofolate synthase family protein [soil metagenome]
MDRSTAILERFRTLYPREIDLSLDRMRVLMEKLGNPDRRMPPVIHIAGTNGKGSTTAFLRAMLEAAGKSVHVYTSPHLVRFHERMRIGAPGGGHFVGEDALIDALLEVERVNADAPIPQFEITTAAAFQLFAQHPADYTLLEVGLGGRYDATNIVPDPVVCAITSISFDHEKFFGDTLDKIAAEKAGILKRGRPVVVSPQPDIVLDVIDAEAARMGAPVFVGNQDWVSHSEHGRMVYQDVNGLMDLPKPKLVGRHQFTNAGLAVAALRYGQIGIPAAAIESGLTSVDWPARMQRLTHGRLVARARADAEIWLDGGHNPGGGLVVAEAMADLEERVSRPLFMICGMLNTKDPVGFFRPFAGLVRSAWTVPVPSSAAGRDPAELAEIARAAGIDATPVADVETALNRISALTGLPAPPRILICGSLYLAGTVLDANGTPPV